MIFPSFVHAVWRRGRRDEKRKPLSRISRHLIIFSLASMKNPRHMPRPAADASMSQAIFSSSHKHLTNTTSAKRLELGGAMVPRILRQATMKIPSRTRQPVASRYQSTTFVHLGT